MEFSKHINVVDLPTTETITRVVPLGKKLVLFTASQAFVLRPTRWYERLWRRAKRIEALMFWPVTLAEWLSAICDMVGLKHLSRSLFNWSQMQ